MAGDLQTSFGPAYLIRGYLRGIRPSGVDDQIEKEYLGNLIGQYEETCRETLGSKGSDGDTFIRNSDAENRFAQSLGAFFPKLSKTGGEANARVISWLYGDYLKNGGNCPEGSPASKLPSILATRYSVLAEMLERELDRNLSKKDIDEAFDDVMEDDEDKAAKRQAAETEISLLRNAIVLAGAMDAVVKNPKADRSQFPIHEILIDTLSDPGRRFLGLKLLNMVRIGPDNTLRVVPHFDELVSSVSERGTPFFRSLLDVLSKPGGENVIYDFLKSLPPLKGSGPDPLIERLAYAVAKLRLSDKGVEFVKKTIKLASDKKKGHELAEEMITLYENPKKLEMLQNMPYWFERLQELLLEKSQGLALFSKFYQNFPNSNGEQIDKLLVHLLSIALKQQIKGVPTGVIMEALDNIKKDHKYAELLTGLLKNSKELEIMRRSESADEYIRDYLARKGMGRGGNGAGPGGFPVLPPSSLPNGPVNSTSAATAKKFPIGALGEFDQPTVGWGVWTTPDNNFVPAAVNPLEAPCGI